MASRRATAEEVDAWRTDGWVLLEGLVSTDEIDAVLDDLHEVFPTTEEYHDDPDGEIERRRGRPKMREEAFVWPDDGPGFRPAQQLWSQVFPFAGSGALNRLCVHPSVVDFAEQALDTSDIRLYQIHLTAKYEGLTNYEQPLHTDRNHSWLPAVGSSPWWNLEGFLYLSDVTVADNPTRMVSTRDTGGVSPRTPVLMPDFAPDLYAAERPAIGVRGSYLAYRSDVFHRGAAFGSPGTARTVLALAFKNAGHEWIGYDQAQSRSTGPEWTRFAQRCSPRELELFGFPPPGHPVWTDALLDETAIRYPKLDLGPWREGLRPGAEVQA
jgi:hypothetical protein